MADCPLVCVACNGSDAEPGLEFCRECIADMAPDDPELCPCCLCSPCADPRGCRIEASREERADRRRDGEWE